MTSFPAKILLFGEHTILRGGRGLAVPYPRLSIRWERGEADPRLLLFAEHLRTCVPAQLMDLRQLDEEFRQGYRLTGNIPTGYGLGSSGAVCAAIFERYATREAKALPIHELRKLLARMEEHFHGRSSGTDPLICYLSTPIVLAGGAAGAVNLPEGWRSGFFLLDTGIRRSASDLIENFLGRYDGGLSTTIETGWAQPAGEAIDALIGDNRADLIEAFTQISSFQLTHFTSFIPDPFQDVWDGGHAYCLKLCGAGGGGMLLGLARDTEATEKTLGAGVRWLNEKS